MVISYCKRSTSTSLLTTDDGSDSGSDVRRMWDVSGTSSTSSVSVNGSSVWRRKWQTATDEPNQSNWGGGNYVWTYRVTTANAAHNIIEVLFRRVDSSGTVLASKSSGTLSISLTATTHSGTVVWNDTTINPVGRDASDRLEVVFRIQNTGGSATSHSVATGLTDDNIDTALDGTVPSGGGSPVTATVTGKAVVNKFISHYP